MTGQWNAGGEAARTGIVTPEAVRLEFPDAGIGSRGVALLIDAIVLFATLLVISLGAAAAFSLIPVPGWVVVTTLLVLNFVVLFGYPIVCEVGFGGRSLGKLALGLRVVTREGAPVGFRHAAVRSAFMLVDFMVTLGAGAVISAALTRRSQRLGDLVAGTVVLRQRHAHGEARSTAFALPIGTKAYAATISADVVDAATANRVRAFLLRAPQLTDEARHGVAVTLAEPLLSATPPPPSGMDPVMYLTVIMSVYQQRRGHPASASRRGIVAAGHDSGTAKATDRGPQPEPKAGRSDVGEGGFSAPG